MALLLCSCAERAELSLAPYDRPLRIVSVEPGLDTEVALDQTFVLTFNDYIDPRPLTFFNTATLTSGGVRASIRTDYRMVDKALIVSNRREMRSGLLYDLVLSPEVLASVTGQSFEAPEGLRFLAGSHFETRADESGEAPRWADVEPLFAPCNVCHADPEWKLVPITRAALVGQASSQRPELMLVRPFDPPSSYLMHKILYDYPRREGSAQPPPWAGYEEMSRGALRLVESWIRAGALD